MSGDGEKWLIPLAVWLAAERVRVDAANTMRHAQVVVSTIGIDADDTLWHN